MAALETVRARIDGDLKRDAVAALGAMGLTASEAIRLLFVRVAAEGALPFDVRTPNAKTRAAITTAELGEVQRFQSVESLMEDLNG